LSEAPACEDVGAAVAAVKRKKGKAGSGWSWRLAGIALCAFFVLGVITGLSQPGRLLAHRIEALLQRLPYSGRSQLIPAAYHALLFKESTTDTVRQLAVSTALRPRTDAIALAERSEGFYQIDSKGGLFGPLSPVYIPDLPILSGAALEHARAPQLVEYAGNVIRAEALLGAVVSEMRVRAHGEIRLYLDRPHLVIVLASTGFSLQLSHAAKVLKIWQQHRELVGMIDVTVPGEAIVRPKAEAIERDDGSDSEFRPIKFNALKGRVVVSH
jgi:hypothetical protein